VEIPDLIIAAVAKHHGVLVIHSPPKSQPCLPGRPVYVG